MKFCFAGVNFLQDNKNQEIIVHWLEKRQHPFFLASLLPVTKMLNPIKNCDNIFSKANKIILLL